MRWVAKHARQSHLCVRVMARGEVAPPGLGMYAVDNIEIEAQEVEGRDQG